MTKSMTQIVCVALTATLLTIFTADTANAQYPVVVQPTVPAVVGYTAQPAGLFGLRTRITPVVAPVAAAPVGYVAPARVVQYRAPVAPAIRYRAPVTTTLYTPAPVVASVTPVMVAF